jgi:hypothetical protein
MSLIGIDVNIGKIIIGTIMVDYVKGITTRCLDISIGIKGLENPAMTVLLDL